MVLLKGKNTVEIMKIKFQAFEFLVRPENEDGYLGLSFIKGK